MFGLFCKGIHCAGCGKGIPLGLVLLIVALVVKSAHVINGAAGEISNALYVLAASIVAGSIGTALIVGRLAARHGQLNYARWDDHVPFVVQHADYAAGRWPYEGATDPTIFLPRDVNYVEDIPTGVESPGS